MKDMTYIEMTTLARSLFDAFAKGDLDSWQAVLSQDFTWSYPGVANGRGIAAARAYNEPFNAAFTDWVTDVHAAAIDGETVFLQMTVHATHAAPLALPQGSLPPTGKRGAVPCLLVAKFHDGLIVHEATYWNVPDLMAHIS